MMDWSVIAAVNNQQVLNSCLLRSPDLGSAEDLILQTGFDGAAKAFNSGMRKSKGEIMVFVHQDVYLPEGWISRLRSSIKAIAAHDPYWGVIGAWGVKNCGGYAGHVYWQGIAGGEFEGGIEVGAVDELLLVVRRSSGLSFDEGLRGFHMYGADICLEARRRGMKSYAISAFCIHCSVGYRLLPLEFWKAYFYMRRKWKSELPIRTTCTEITRYCWPMVKWNVIHAVNAALGREETRERVADPTLLFKSFVRRQAMEPPNVDAVTAPANTA